MLGLRAAHFLQWKGRSGVSVDGSPEQEKQVLEEPEVPR